MVLVRDVVKIISDWSIKAIKTMLFKRQMI